jgi:RND family efflux transporter MFP subunit
VPIILALALVAVAVVAWLLNRPSVPVVEVAEAREVVLGERATVLNASGYVVARRQATVSSKVTGKVVEVLIEEGMRVENDQVLARLDTSNVEVSLALAQARLSAARATLEEIEVRIREADLELGRVQRLVEQRVASQADLDGAQAEADSLRARLEAQKVQVVVAGREAEVWRQNLADTVIRAPFAGIIVTKNAQPGEMISPVSAGGGFTRTGIGTVVDMDSLEIEVDVNEAYINRVVADQRVEATLDAYSDWTIPAHVIAIVPTADRQKATVRVRIGIDVDDPRILPDMGVKVAFQGEEVAQGPRSGVTIPRAALRSDDGRDVVFVLSGSTVERRAVRSEPGEDARVLVRSGIAAGESVVVSPPAELGDGDEVEVRR